MRKKIACFLSSLLLAGCASYEIPNEVSQKSDSMSLEFALKTINSQIRPTEKQLGMCYHHIYPKPATHSELTMQPLEMKDHVISVKYVAAEVPDDVKKIIAETLAKTGTVRRPGADKEGYLFDFDLTKLARVFVSDVAYATSCQGKKGRFVELQNKEPLWGVHTLTFHIAPENVNTFLAAVKKMAPDAPFRVPPL